MSDVVVSMGVNRPAPTLLALVASACASTRTADTIVLVSANTEWKVLHETFHEPDQQSPAGEWFVHHYPGARDVLFFHGGWGKISAAASTQYVIDRWRPRRLVNLGTCGGFEGRVRVGDVILADRTLVYDIVEAMGDPDEAIEAYATRLDPSIWPAALRGEVRTEILVSADKDLVPGDIPRLIERYRASAGDWESGAIAWTAKKNGTPVVILRGVSDVVGAGGSVTYGDMGSFEKGTRVVMARLLDLFARALEYW
jgi:adenosylhomocysteine nucleosidase